MSQENVDVVRRGLEAFNQGDIDGALDMCDPRVEVRTLLSGSAPTGAMSSALQSWNGRS